MGSAVQSRDVAAWRVASAGRDALGLHATGAPGWSWEAVTYWESGFLGWSLCVAGCSGPLMACSAGLTPASTCSLPLPTGHASLGFGA